METGAFFSPGVGIVVSAHTHKMQDDVADEAERRVLLLQQVYFKNPTGFYSRHIENRDLGDHHLIHDSGVIYGPWLEGIGSRNYPVTRFPGYEIFRQVAQEMDRRAVYISQPAIHDLVEVLNR